MSEGMMISKGVALLANTTIFYQVICEWSRMKKNPELMDEVQNILPDENTKAPENHRNIQFIELHITGKLLCIGHGLFVCKNQT